MWGVLEVEFEGEATVVVVGEVQVGTALVWILELVEGDAVVVVVVVG